MRKARMTWNLVNSSDIHKIAFDRKADILHVVFKNGRYYTVSKCEYGTYVKLKRAASPGGFYNAYIRDNEYYTIQEVTGKTPTTEEQKDVILDQLDKSFAKLKEG